MMVMVAMADIGNDGGGRANRLWERSLERERWEREKSIT